ncbi:MAG: fimbrial assembly protein [Rhodoglobus sp.]
MSDKKPVARREVKVAIAYPPHVRLLPPEVGQRKAANRARGRAIFVAIIALGVAILAAGGANLVALQRVLALDTARTTTLSLTQQQGEYNDVRTANQQLQSSTSARIFATSTEISIRTVLGDLGDKLTPGMAIGAYDFETATPLLGYGVSVSPLDPERMAMFSMRILAPTLAELDVWVRSGGDVAGVADISVVSAEWNEEGFYTGQVAILVSRDALLHRFDGFVPEGEEAESEEDAAPAPTETPVPSETPAPAVGTNEEESGS